MALHPGAKIESETAPTPDATFKGAPIYHEPLTANRVFIGFYHFRSSKPHERVFNFSGDLQAARNRFYEHCKIMNYRFISVRPFIVDLDSVENTRDNYDEINAL